MKKLLSALLLSCSLFTMSACGKYEGYTSTEKQVIEIFNEHYGEYQELLKDYYDLSGDPEIISLTSGNAVTPGQEISYIINFSSNGKMYMALMTLKYNNGKLEFKNFE